jgi:hypothetical protein
VSELFLVLMMLPVFRLIGDSSRVRLSEIATDLGSTNHCHINFRFQFVSSCYSDAYVANAAVVEKASISGSMSS